MIYVMSDIHGHKEHFDSVMAQIDLQTEDTLYILGDVIDRNPDGIAILLQLMAMPNVQMLLGNHEDIMLETLYRNNNDKEEGWAKRAVDWLEFWYENGGQDTLNALMMLPKETRMQVLEYLDQLPLSLEVAVGDRKYILAHAAPASMFDEWDPEGYFVDSKAFALWYRPNSSDRYPGEATVIVGHTPTSFLQNKTPLEVWYGNNLIDIDCGASYSEDVFGPIGRVACLRLDDMKVFYSTAEESCES